MDARSSHAPLVVVMGVTGSGKSVVGRPLAERLGVEYGEGDDFHPRRNIEKMAAGHPLDDADRQPWLKAIGDWLHARRGSGAVVACSALKRSYRDLLRSSAPDCVFLHLVGSRELLAERIQGRRGHFMPLSLLDSQLATLEPLGADEAGVEADISQPVESSVETFLLWWRNRTAASSDLEPGAAG